MCSEPCQPKAHVLIHCNEGNEHAQGCRAGAGKENGKWARQSPQCSERSASQCAQPPRAPQRALQRARVAPAQRASGGGQGSGQPWQKNGGCVCNNEGANIAGWRVEPSSSVGAHAANGAGHLSAGSSGAEGQLRGHERQRAPPGRERRRGRRAHCCEVRPRIVNGLHLRQGKDGEGQEGQHPGCLSACAGRLSCNHASIQAAPPTAADGKDGAQGCTRGRGDACRALHGGRMNVKQWRKCPPHCHCRSVPGHVGLNRVRGAAVGRAGEPGHSPLRLRASDPAPPQAGSGVCCNAVQVAGQETPWGHHKASVGGGEGEGVGRGRAWRRCCNCPPHASAGQASEGPQNERGAQRQGGGRGRLAGSSCAWGEQAQLLPVQKPPLALRHGDAAHSPHLRRSAEQLKRPHICRQHQGHAGGGKGGSKLGCAVSCKGAAGICLRFKLCKSGAGGKKAPLGRQGACLRQGTEL